MTTTMSSSKKKAMPYLLHSVLRQNVMAMLLFAVCLIFWTTMDTVNTVMQFDPSFQSAHIPLLSGSYAFLFFGGSVPVLLAAVLFHYLHNRQSVDFYHSLPITRTQLFFSRYFAGLIFLLVPVILAKLLVLIVQFVNLYGPYYSAATLLSYAACDLLFWLIMYTLVFTLSCMVAVTASNDVESIVYSVAVNGLLSGLGIIITVFPNSLFGVRIAVEPLEFLSPYGVMLFYADRFTYNFGHPVQSLPTAFIWLALGVLGLWVAIRLYNRFQSEWAQQWGRQTPFTQVMKVCAGILATFVLFSFRPLPGLVACALLSAVIGAPVGYLIVEGITGKGFQKLKKNLPYIAATLLICLCAPLFLATDGFGTVEKVPQADDVKSVEVQFYGANQYYSYAWVDHNGNYQSLEESNTNSVTVTDPQAIGIVTQLHEIALDHRDYLGEMSNRISFTYSLKGIGGKMQRIYSLPASAIPLIEELRCQPEVIEQSEPVFAYTPEVLESVECYDKTGTKVASIAPEQRQQLLEAVRTDLVSLTADRLNDPTVDPQIGYLDWVVKEYDEQTGKNLDLHDELTSLRYGSSQLILRSSYKHTLSLLKSWGIDLENSGFSAVERLVISMPLLDDVQLDLQLTPQLRLCDQPGSYDQNLSWPVDDPEKIEQILQAASLNRTSIACHPIYLQVGNSTQSYMGPLYIENSTLLSILKGSDIQIPYLLSAKEYGEFSANYNQGLPAAERSTTTVTSTYNPDGTSGFDIFDTSTNWSVAEYARQCNLDWFEGKTEEQLAAMEYTAFGKDHALFYQEYILY